MKIAANKCFSRFGVSEDVYAKLGMSTMTFTNRNECKHLNGWYVTVPFWIFRKRIFVCSDCGERR